MSFNTFPGPTEGSWLVSPTSISLVPTETAALTRAQVLQQAGTAMLSQANSLPNNVLSLLR